MLSPLWAAVLFKLHADIFLAGPSPQVQLCHSMFWQEQGCVLPNLMTAQIWYYSVWPNSWLRRGVTHLLSTQTVFTLQRLHSVHNLLRQCLLLQGLHCIRAPPRRGRYWEIHPRRPRDFPRPERNLEGRGKSWGRRGWISQYFPSFGGVRTFSSSSILSLGMEKEIHPCGQGRIDSVKINPSLLMMRKWILLT